MSGTLTVPDGLVLESPWRWLFLDLAQPHASSLARLRRVALLHEDPLPVGRRGLYFS